MVDFGEVLGIVSGQGFLELVMDGSAFRAFIMNRFFIFHPNPCGRLLKWIILGVMIACPLEGETIYMKNGDLLSGKIVKKTNSKLSVETRYAGVIHIDRSEVKNIGEKRVVSRPIKKLMLLRKEKAPAMSGQDPVLVAEADLGEPEDDGSEKDPTKGKFTGNVHFALKSENGNNDQDEIDFDFYLHYEQGAHRYHVYGQMDYDLRSGENTKRDWQLYPVYDYFLTEKLYASLSYSAKQEKFAGLDLRQSIGPSIGYESFKGAPITLKNSLGVYFVDEKHTEREDAHYFGPGWNLEYKHDMLDGKMQLYHRHFSSVNIQDMGKFLWHSWTGIRVPIMHGIVVSSEMEINYDGQPSLKAEPLDTTFRVKLGYEW